MKEKNAQTKRRMTWCCDFLHNRNFSHLLKIHFQFPVCILLIKNFLIKSYQSICLLLILPQCRHKKWWKEKKKSLNNFFLPFQSPSPSRFLFKLFFLFIIYYEFIFFLAQLNSTLVRTYIHNELNKTKNGSSLKVFGCREGKLRNVKNIDWARIWADNGRAIKKQSLISPEADFDE